MFEMRSNCLPGSGNRLLIAFRMYLSPEDKPMNGWHGSTCFHTDISGNTSQKFVIVTSKLPT